MRIKICGLRRPEDIHAVNACLPDYIGFVFARSKRRVSESEAAALKSLLSPKIAAVGVFVDEPPERVAALLERGLIDIAQLHGTEDAVYLRQLRALTSAPVIKAVAALSAERVRAAEALKPDYLLLDATSGGSGQSFDWDTIPALETPWFLAGGLNAENLAQAAACKPFCLDISSGAETSGYKDPEKIRLLTEKARML